MPEILRMFGMSFFFYSREHEPIHVHVKKAGGKAKFEITDDEVVLIYNKGLSINDLKNAEEVLLENHSLAVAKWREYFGSAVNIDEAE